MPFDLLLVVVVLFAVLCPEFGAVAGDQDTTGQIMVLCYLNGTPENLFDGFRIISSEIGNGVVDWLCLTADSQQRHPPHAPRYHDRSIPQAIPERGLFDSCLCLE